MWETSQRILDSLNTGSASERGAYVQSEMGRWGFFLNQRSRLLSIEVLWGPVLRTSSGFRLDNTVGKGNFFLGYLKAKE